MLSKSKLNSVEFLISKSLIDPNIGHDEFVLIKNVLKECNDMKEEIKNLKTYLIARVVKVFDRKREFIEDFILFTKQCYRIAWSVEKIQKVKIQELWEQKTEE